MKRLFNATLGIGTAALLSLAACGGDDAADMDSGMADTGLGATMPAPAPAPLDSAMRDTMMMPDTMMRDTMMPPPPGA